MTEAKVEIRVGEIAFSGQGEQEWVARQLDKILGQADKLIQLAPPPGEDNRDGGGRKPMGKDQSIAKQTLPSFLQEKNAGRNQIKKFLATAVWLEAKGQNRLQTSDITKALKDANQARLGNPADCLNKNVSKATVKKMGNSSL
jgi:hypothetical protein